MSQNDTGVKVRYEERVTTRNINKLISHIIFILISHNFIFIKVIGFTYRRSFLIPQLNDPVIIILIIIVFIL